MWSGNVEIAYYYYFGGQKGAIMCTHSSESEHTSLLKNLKPWKTGDVVRIELDCDNWPKYPRLMTHTTQPGSPLPVPCYFDTKRSGP